MPILLPIRSVFSIGAGSSGGPEISIQSSSAQRASRNLDPLPCARPAPDLRGPGRSHWPSEVLCFLRVHGPVRSFTRATLQDARSGSSLVAPPLFSWYSQVLPRCFSSVLTSQVALPPGPIVPRDRGVGPVRDEDESQRQAYDSDSQPADGRPAIEQMGEYDALHNGTMLPQRQRQRRAKDHDMSERSNFPRHCQGLDRGGRASIFPLILSTRGSSPPQQGGETVLNKVLRSSRKDVISRQKTDGTVR